jgi:hypothetical protein
MNLDSGVTDYLQCAGSANRMTVEVRRILPTGLGHYVIGRVPTEEDLGAPETIYWSDYVVQVSTNELFDSHEAETLFVAYYDTNWVPDEYVLRPMKDNSSIA